MAPERSQKNFTKTINNATKQLNPLQPYEQTIATKLDELPPNLLGADAIWADIAAQLDNDQPGGDDAPAPGNQPTGAGSWATGIKLAIGAAGIALVAYWLTQTNNPSSATAPPVPTAKKTITSDTFQQPQPVQPTGTNPNQPPPSTVPPPASGPTVPDNRAMPPITVDSFAAQPVDKPAAKTDSALAPAPTPPLALPPLPKKKRGTQGIKDSDYKFIPGRDST
jgi:hypothetical protein